MVAPARRMAWLGLSLVTALQFAACADSEETAAAAGGSAGSSADASSDGANGGSAGAEDSGAGGSAGAAGASSAGAAGMGGNAGVPVWPAAPELGKACRLDTDCPNGLSCLDPVTGILQGGGPAKGYCTRNCTPQAAAGAADPCPQLMPGAFCANFNTPQQVIAYCVQPCATGAQIGVDPYDWNPQKCHGRHEVACVRVNAQRAACLPSCNNDEECGGGFYCNPRSGMCVPAPSAGDAVGSSCDQQADACRGTCTQLGILPGLPPPLVCVERCVFGELKTCGNDDDFNTPEDAACLFSYSTTDTVGDIAACGQLCDCDAECRHPNFYCKAESFLEQDFGRKGYCTPTPAGGPSGNLPCAGDAGADATTDSGAAGASGDGGASDAALD